MREHPAPSFPAVDEPRPPRNSQPTLDAIRETGGEELVRELYASFSDFAAAQVAWLDRLANVHAYDGLHEGARVMRISARQVGVFDAAEACEHLQAAALAHDAAAVAASLEDLHDVLAAARPWVDALAAG